MKILSKATIAVITIIIMLSFTVETAAADNEINEYNNTADSSVTKVYLGGMPFGVKLYANELTVVGFSEVETELGPKNPAYDAGIRENDLIISINSKNVTEVSDIVDACDNSNGKPITVDCKRNGKIISFSFAPSLCMSDGRYKTGMWIKDGVSGIGTVTYIVPETGAFAGLGHPICNSLTGEKEKILKGIVTFADISGVEKGSEGNPGELIGSMKNDKAGIIVSNSDSGVYGIFSTLPDGIDEDDLIETSPLSEAETGSAKIKCTLDGKKAEYYDINLINIESEDDTNKNFIIEVTDKELIDKTGGIVQGMSGSPIIQNGKLIGAVTHVFISDPTKGYGISISEMQSNMPDILT